MMPWETDEALPWKTDEVLPCETDDDVNAAETQLEAYLGYLIPELLSLDHLGMLCCCEESFDLNDSFYADCY